MRKLRLSATIALIAAVLGTAGCEAGTEGSGARIVSVDITTPSLSLSQGESQRIAATIVDADGNTLETVAGVTWASENNSVVSVTQSGEVRGVALGGPVTVTVSVGGKSATTSVTVIPASISFSPPDSTLAVGHTRQLVATLRDVDDAPIASDAVVEWSSSNTNVATIGASSGVITSVASGQTVISAAAAGRTGSFTLYVGVPSVYDGAWAGTSNVFDAVPNRSMTVSFDVMFGQVRNFKLTWINTASACAFTIIALAPPSLISNAAFVAVAAPPSQPQSTTSAATVLATFTSPTAMTATQSAMSFGALACPGGTGSVPGQVAAGSITALKAQ